MKRDLHENFEDFLKNNADSLRMKAPERVWQKLSGELTKKRRRFGFGLSAFFLLASVFSYFTISNNSRSFPLANNPGEGEQTASFPADSNTSTAEVSKTPVIPITSHITRAAGAGYRPYERQAVVTDRTTPLTTPTDEVTPVQTEETVAVEQSFEPTIVDSYPEEASTATASPRQNEPVLLSALPDVLPLTIESVLNSYSEKQKSRKNRFQTQFHFAPTISYRKLTENKSYLRNSPQQLSQTNYSALYNSVNSMVTHKPDIGFELGVTEKYAVSQNLRIRAGLQFNVNRYNIKAFHAPYAVATIALNNRRSARVDSLYSLTNYSNVDVNRSNKGSWLQNFSFQASAPVGVELALKGNEKMQFGIATTIQPTYILGDRAYMITSDYKSYTQVPWLLRRWNVNTALETFVMYHSGKTTWQVGPQVRYQLLSSFITNYPVKENLFDFGLRVGVSFHK